MIDRNSHALSDIHFMFTHPRLIVASVKSDAGASHFSVGEWLPGPLCLAMSLLPYDDDDCLFVFGAIGKCDGLLVCISISLWALGSRAHLIRFGDGRLMQKWLAVVVKSKNWQMQGSLWKGQSATIRHDWSHIVIDWNMRRICLALRRATLGIDPLHRPIWFPIFRSDDTHGWMCVTVV